MDTLALQSSLYIAWLLICYILFIILVGLAQKLMLWLSWSLYVEVDLRKVVVSQLKFAQVKIQWLFWVIQCYISYLSFYLFICSFLNNMVSI
jgi:hypothetical protein